MDEVFRVTARWRRLVTLTSNRWISHIVANYPELASSADAIADTVHDPTQVRYDRAYPDRGVYYRPSPRPEPWRGLLLRVVVAGGTDSRVVTAHLIEDPHRGERHRWP
jgi:hypothetical protein